MNRRHFYRREPDPLGQDSLARLGRWIEREATVLELGPGSGYFTQYLTQRLDCTVDVVERDPDMAECVRPWCRRVVVADLDTWNAEAELKFNKYNYIVLADVLEHLRDPETLLNELKGFLAEAGAILVSVPNMAYAGLMADLMRGEFVYRDEGLLDRTHIHFFTQNSLFAMLKRSGLYVWKCEGVNKPLNESEFESRYESLSTAMKEALTEIPYAFCYQWVVDARPDMPPEPLVVPEVPRDAFPVRVFWEGEENDFSYEKSVVGWGAMTQDGPQLIELDLPKEAQGSIRIRLSDRPGFIRLYSMKVFSKEGRALGFWEASAGASGLIQDSMNVLLGDERADDSGRTYIPITVQNGESWVELSDSFGKEGGVKKVGVEFIRPISSDYRAAVDKWTQESNRLQGELERIKELVVERDSMLEMNAHKIQALEKDLAQQALMIEKKNSEIMYRQSFRWWLKLPVLRLLSKLQSKKR